MNKYLKRNIQKNFKCCHTMKTQKETNLTEKVSRFILAEPICISDSNYLILSGAYFRDHFGHFSTTLEPLIERTV